MLIRFALFAAIAVWTAGIFAQHLAVVFPFLAEWLPFVSKSYSIVCHQDEAKVVTLFGKTTMVCARCLGIYSGALLVSLAVFILPLNYKPHVKLLFAAAAIVLADVLLTTLGVYQYSKSFALFTGLLLGSVGFLYFYNAVKLLVTELQNKKQISEPIN